MKLQFGHVLLHLPLAAARLAPVPGLLGVRVTALSESEPESELELDSTSSHLTSDPTMEVIRQRPSLSSASSPTFSVELELDSTAAGG